MTSDDIQLGTLMATVAAVIVTAIATRISYTIARRQSRPDVIIYTEHDSKRTTLITLIIKNIGTAAAINVRFYPSEPVPARAFGFAPLSDQDKKIHYQSDGPLVQGIPFLPPGGTRIIDWGQYGGLHNAIGDRAIKIRAEYYMQEDANHLPELIKTESFVDIKSYEGTNASDLDYTKIKSKELEEISASLRKLSQNGIRVTIPEKT